MMPLTGLGFESQATCLLDVVSCEFWRRKPWGSQFRVGTAQLLFALSRQTVEGPVRAGIVEHGALYLSVLSLSHPFLMVRRHASTESYCAKARTELHLSVWLKDDHVGLGVRR